MDLSRVLSVSVEAHVLGRGQSPPAGDSDLADTAWSLFGALLCTTSRSGRSQRPLHARSVNLEFIECNQAIAHDATSLWALVPSPVSPKGSLRAAGNDVSVIVQSEKNQYLLQIFTTEKSGKTCSLGQIPENMLSFFSKGAKVNKNE